MFPVTMSQIFINFGINKYTLMSLSLAYVCLMKNVKRFLVAACILFSAFQLYGQYSVQHCKLILRDAERGNRRVPVEVYYPYRASDDNLNSSCGGITRFPVICFAHGYQYPADQYGNLTGLLVPEGYIMLNIATCSGLFPSHKRYADDIRFLADKLIWLGNDTTSPLYGIVDTICCLMGHSMGGGAVFHAAADNNVIDGVVALAPYDTRPSAIDASAAARAPTLIFSGTGDCITPPEKYHLPMYEKCGATNKTYILIKGGTHCGMGEYKKCFEAERLKRCDMGLTTAEQTEILARYLLPWLGFFLKGEDEQANIFNQTLMVDEQVTVLRSRPMSKDCSINLE
jgi:pimeloyl-ACP methyl ester carboxylesterase